MKNSLKNNRGSFLISGGAAIGILILAVWLVVTPTYNSIRHEAMDTADIANARMIISATAAHNALAEVNEEYGKIITYDMLMGFSTLGDFNNASEIDINSLSDEDFDTARTYIYEDEYGDFIILE